MGVMNAYKVMGICVCFLGGGALADISCPGAMRKGLGRGSGWRIPIAIAVNVESSCDLRHVYVTCTLKCSTRVLSAELRIGRAITNCRGKTALH